MPNILRQTLNIKEVVLICTTIFGVGYALAQRIEGLKAELHETVTKPQMQKWSKELREKNPSVIVPSFAETLLEARK